MPASQSPALLTLPRSLLQAAYAVQRTKYTSLPEFGTMSRESWNEERQSRHMQLLQTRRVYRRRMACWKHRKFVRFVQ